MSEFRTRRELLEASLRLGAFLPVLTTLGPRAALAHAQETSESDEQERTPQVLTPSQLELLGDVAEILLPTTDTPGAKAAGVHWFIDDFIGGWFPTDARESYLRGVGAFERLAARATEDHGVSLEDVVAGAAARAASARDGAGPSVSRAKLAATGFYDVTRWLVLQGYYTSEIGMRQELGWLPLPGRWNPCVDLKKPDFPNFRSRRPPG